MLVANIYTGKRDTIFGEFQKNNNVGLENKIWILKFVLMGMLQIL